MIEELDVFLWLFRHPDNGIVIYSAWRGICYKVVLKVNRFDILVPIRPFLFIAPLLLFILSNCFLAFTSDLFMECISVKTDELVSLSLFNHGNDLNGTRLPSKA